MGPVAEFMVKMMVYDETMNFIHAFNKHIYIYIYILFVLGGVQGTVGGLPGGLGAADEQKRLFIKNRFVFFSLNI